jgi:exoribonuclease R
MDTPVRILIADRNYTSWSFERTDTDAPVDAPAWLPSDFHPATAKLFTKDVISVDHRTTTILHSPARYPTSHAGVLQLSTQRTYGRAVVTNRLLYKCIPDDKYLPAFLVPYEIKLGFSKAVPDKFVVFRFASWEDKHPQGLLVETLGDVDSLDAFYEYQLYCKSLHDSITRMTQATRTALNRKPTAAHVEYIRKTFAQRDCTNNNYIFSIDPPHSLDFDDALSICELDEDRIKVSVYIANVFVWLESLDLWQSLTNRVATIYLPDRRRPMLPTTLSDALCSLQAGEDRFAFVCEMTVDKTAGGIQGTPQFFHSFVRVAKNFRYEEPALSACNDYQTLLKWTQYLDTSCKDSHDVVAFWMVQTNRQCASHMAPSHVGIFRVVTFTPDARTAASEDTATMSEDARRVIRTWNNTTGQYVHIHEGKGKEEQFLRHDLLDCNAYVHMTSPIRRLVDLLNHMIFSVHFLDVSLSPAATLFLQTWLGKMDYLNVAMRSIRKVQTDCHLVHRCSTDQNVLDKVHRGVVFDRIATAGGYYQYMVYLEDLQLLARVRCCASDIPNYAVRSWKIFVFENEEKTKRKIRLALIQDQKQITSTV